MPERPFSTRLGTSMSGRRRSGRVSGQRLERPQDETGLKRRDERAVAMEPERGAGTLDHECTEAGLAKVAVVTRDARELLLHRPPASGSSFPDRAEL